MIDELLVASFDDPNAAASAAGKLVARGVVGVRVTSPVPYPAVRVPHPPRSLASLGWLSLGGALGTFIGGLVMVVYTSLAQPLSVGGMPVLSWPAFAVVLFEVTLLGAGVATFVSAVVLGAQTRRRLPARAREATAAGLLSIIVPVARLSPAEIAEIRASLTGAREVSP
jgi:hypothetical protein